MCLNKAMPLIEAVGMTATQSAHPDGHVSRIRIRKNLLQHKCTHSFSLVFGQNVEVIEQPMTFVRANQNKADTSAIGLDETAHCWVEGNQKTFASPPLIEAPDMFKALSHRCNANGHQSFSIKLGSGR